MIGSTQKFEYKLSAATCARADCHSGGRGRLEAMSEAKLGTLLDNLYEFGTNYPMNQAF